MRKATVMLTGIVIILCLFIGVVSVISVPVTADELDNDKEQSIKNIIGPGMIEEINNGKTGLRVIEDQYIYVDDEWRNFTDVVNLNFDDINNKINVEVGSQHYSIDFIIDYDGSKETFNDKVSSKNDMDLSVKITKTKNKIVFDPTFTTGDLNAKEMKFGFNITSKDKLLINNNLSIQMNEVTFDFSAMETKQGYELTEEQGVIYVKVNEGVNVLDPDLHITNSSFMFGNHEYDYVDIEEGGILTIQGCGGDCSDGKGFLNLTVTNWINVSGNGTINGRGDWYVYTSEGGFANGGHDLNGFGQGGGTFGNVGANSGGAGGAGHGGLGGNGGAGGGSAGTAGGKAYGNLTWRYLYNASETGPLQIFRGSGGAEAVDEASHYAEASNGGSGLRIKADEIIVSGFINVSTTFASIAGSPHDNGGAGGGSGGLIILDGNTVNLDGGSFEAFGSRGGDGVSGITGGGGGGAGGRIKIFYHSLVNTSTHYDVTGGTGGLGFNGGGAGQDGEDGTIYFELTADVILPVSFTHNLTEEYPNNVSVLFNFTDDTSTDSFSINDTTNFEINKTGFLFNKTHLQPQKNVYWLQIAVNDSTNQTVFTEIWINITDEEAPAVTTHNLSRNYPTNISVQFNFTDNYLTDSFSVDNTTNWEINKTGFLFNKSFIKPQLLPHELKITVNDSLNNTKFVQILINVTDSTLSIIVLTQPENATYNGTSDLDLNFTATHFNIDSCYYTRNETDTPHRISCSNQLVIPMLSGRNNLTLWVNTSTNSTNSTHIAFTTNVNSTTIHTQDLTSNTANTAVTVWVFYNLTNGTSIIDTVTTPCSVTGEISGDMNWDNTNQRYERSDTLGSAKTNANVTITCSKITYQTQVSIDYFNITSATTTTTIDGGGGGGGGGGIPIGTFDVDLSPPVITIDITPESVKRIQFTIFNPSETDQTISCEFIGQEPDMEAPDWFGFIDENNDLHDKTILSIIPGARRTVNAMVEVPEEFSWNERDEPVFVNIECQNNGVIDSVTVKMIEFISISEILGTPLFVIPNIIPLIGGMVITVMWLILILTIVGIFIWYSSIYNGGSL